MKDPDVIKPEDFRKALGSFPTGVCVVTTLCDDGLPVGVTCSSFNSVSLDPPLILWSLGKNAYSRAAFERASHWAVHILNSGQEQISNRFARAGEDKFADIRIEDGIAGIPLLPDYLTRFQCATEHVYDGGDHIILVGRVLSIDQQSSLPLVFHAGRYCQRIATALGA